MTGSTTWRNWAGNQHATPSRISFPKSVEELASLVKAAARDDQRIKAIGSGHSFTSIGVTDGVQIRLNRLSRLLAADQDTGLVSVQAGMPLHRLNAALSKRGLALTNLGDIDRQTVAGAISTGTHGTGRHLGGLATQVRALQMVLADGSVVTCSPERRPELFTAARVGLGALGIITGLTLQAEPSFVLQAQESPMGLPRVLAELDELVTDNEHFEFFWFPHTEATLTKCNNRLPPDAPLRPLQPIRTLIADEAFGNGLFALTCKLGRRFPALIPRINARTSGMLGRRTYSAASHEVFVSRRRVRFVEMEYGIPAEAVQEAITGTRRVIEQNNFRVSFPVEIRFTAADDIPLSTASGRPSAYVAVHMSRGTPYQKYFRAVESVMKDLGGRPHWGKLHFQNAEMLQTRYPRFSEFVAIRDCVDPYGRFANPYLDRVLGVAAGRH